MLRFAFSETAAGATASVELLTSLQTALQAHVASLQKEYDASHKFMPTSGRLAFESGLRGAEYFLQWTEYAIATYEKRSTQERK